ncbi:MAG: hypothetical protein A3J67_03410 [Parcubacteria group bacterium RIFCSPHIGHO2_02_FULL_48_10b]|nr:MAG: hypothetical protein A3J67_03410 [Parcubacteria group bacterium RIFCSPHIGHO2_02_FULL_48_10b]
MRGIVVTLLFVTAASIAVVVLHFFVPFNAVLDSAKFEIQTTNIDQIASALGLYYLDYSVYPQVDDEGDLVNELHKKGYLRMLFSPDAFRYESRDNGQNYLLEPKKP